MARVRSPNYPAIPLGEAIERVKMVHKAEQHIPAAREVIAKDLGYGGLNGASLKVLSALIKYGLLDEAGDKLKVSERAINIIYAPNAETKAAAIRDAALAPALFADFFEEWKGSVPSDENMKHYLLRRNFAQSAIDGVIQSFKETMDLVTRESGAYPSGGGGQNATGQEKSPMQSTHQQQPPAGNPAIPPPAGRILISFDGDRIVVDAKLDDGEAVDKLIKALTANRGLLPAKKTSDPFQ